MLNLVFRLLINLFDFNFCQSCGSFNLINSGLICHHCHQNLRLVYNKTNALYHTSNVKIYPKYVWDRQNHSLLGPYIKLLKEATHTQLIKDLLLPHSFNYSGNKPLVWIPIPSLKNTQLTQTMAQIMAFTYGGQVQDLLILSQEARPQKTLKRAERMNRKFYLKHEDFKLDPHSEYIFIDDVVTTGFTVSRASVLLNIPSPTVVCFAYRAKTSYRD